MTIQDKQRVVQNAQAFLSRVQIQGSEAPALMEVVHFLESMLPPKGESPAKSGPDKPLTK